MFNKYNMCKKTVRDGIDTRQLEFKQLKEFEGETIHVDGFFFTNSDYGKQVVVVGEGYNINMPKRACDQFEGIADNPEELSAVLDGKLLITDIKANVSSKNGKTTTYQLADAE